MSKITINGTIVRIGETKEIKSGNVREVIVCRKYHDPQSGELKSEDFYPVQVFKDCYEKYQELIYAGKKVSVNGFVNGRRSEKDGSTSYFCNIVAKEFIKS